MRIRITSTICPVIFLLFSSINIIYAQEDWSLIRGSKWQSNLNDVFFVDNSHGWIVGSNSTILHTSNGGKDWIDQPNQPLPFKVELHKVRFISPKLGWVVGGNGTTPTSPTAINDVATVTTVAAVPVESTSVAAGIAADNTIQSNPVTVPQNVPAAVTTTETNTAQNGNSVVVPGATGDTASNANSEVAIVPVEPEPTKTEITVDELRAENLFQTVAELRSVLDNGEQVSPK